MPEPEQIPLLGKMNTDDPEQVFPKGFHTDARNVIFRGEEGNMRAENFPGTRLLFTPTCIAVTILGSPSLPNGIVGVDYSYSFELSGDQPFTWQVNFAPSWMTISIDGNVITFSGTPDTVASNINVNVDIMNCGGMINFTDTFNIATNCVTVTIFGSPALPDGNYHSAYNYSINLNGTAPFTLSIIEKPSWMSIAIVGSTVQFTGTPDTTGVAFNVSIEVTNCGGTVPFADTIDVGNSGAHFDNIVFVFSDATKDYETVDVVGIAGVVATITLDTFTNTNGGTLSVNGVDIFEGQTRNILIGVGGSTTLAVHIDGVASMPGTVMIGHFTITAVTSGVIGTPSVFQISKAFS